MCPDEEGTETVFASVGLINVQIVEACAPMKRGLKHEGIDWKALSHAVEACAPMKRGLKHITPEAIGMRDVEVEACAPMKRGLKQVMKQVTE